MQTSISRYKSVLTLSVAFLLGWLWTSHATPPPPVTDSRRQVTFQARLTTIEGQAYEGDLALAFRIVDGAGQVLWAEAHDGGALPRVPVKGGLVSVVLGAVNPIRPEDLRAGSDAQRWVAIVRLDGGVGTELGRVQLTAAAHAVSAEAATGIWDPTEKAALDLAALDERYVLASGTGGGVVRTIDGLAPDALGDFKIVAGEGIVVTPTAASLVLAVDGAALDGRFVKRSASERQEIASDVAITGELRVNDHHPLLVSEGAVAGDLFYAESSSTLTRLPIGTNGQVLTVGPDGRPRWQTVSSRPRTRVAHLVWQNTNQVQQIDVPFTPDYLVAVAARHVISVPSSSAYLASERYHSVGVYSGETRCGAAAGTGHNNDADTTDDASVAVTGCSQVIGGRIAPAKGHTSARAFFTGPVEVQEWPSGPGLIKLAPQGDAIDIAVGVLVVGH